MVYEDQTILVGFIIFMCLIGLWVYATFKSCARAFFNEKLRYLGEKERIRIKDVKSREVYGNPANQPNDYVAEANRNVG